MKQTHGFANIGRKYKTKKAVRHTMQVLKQRSPDDTIWGFAEIDEADLANEHSILRAVFDQHKFAGAKTRTPIVTPNQFQTVSRRPIKGASGIPHWSPARMIVEQIIDTANWDIPVVRINTHFPRHNAKNGADEEWNKLYGKLQQRHEYWLDRNYVIIGSADTNDHSPHNPVHKLPNARALVDAEIDQIWVALPDDVKCRKITTKKISMSIDGHNGHVVRIDLQEK